MKTKLILAAAALAFALPAKAQVVINLDEITCGQFLNTGEVDRLLISSWVGGYFNSSRNLTLIQSEYVKRNHRVITEYCEKHKSAKLLESVMKEYH
ncbi:HdeA/HdeB family chaperone [uncultured Rhodoblastus sp.]|uniref:HdeA/HdeB family chaperone n=1 Tax=uncultured Rhodoblastus sp. TaxID=543037 RepID=UPI0025E5849C|nr:HdeA/HdeB family chaperone [uncultured Rhodoblastus sp.]